MMDVAFQYVHAVGGLMSEKDYPYKAEANKSAVCRRPHSGGGGVATVNGCYDIEEGNQIDIREAVVTGGPLSIAIEADSRVFQLYTGGVINSPTCGTQLDHGVLLVGYGEEEDGLLYWRIKNSWGVEWGERGYFRLARSLREKDGGICGVAMQASFPVV
jgi:hypothetical protein